MKITLLVLSLGLSACLFAADRPTPEAKARYYIYSALLTQAAPGIVADSVALGPELSRLPHGDGARIYEALVSMTDGKPLEVRRATPEEVHAYGARPGLHEKQPFYSVDAGELKLLVQYDLKSDVISFIGERDTPWEAPKAAELIATKATAAAAGATRLSPQRLEWTGLFAFDSAILSDDARTALDRQIVTRLSTMEVISIGISGHADQIGPEDYNQKLSEWRAGAVADYLAARGVDPARIEMAGYGRRQPVKSCPVDVAAAELIECLAPNRRVVLELAVSPR